MTVKEADRKFNSALKNYDSYKKEMSIKYSGLLLCMNDIENQKMNALYKTYSKACIDRFNAHNPNSQGECHFI